MIALEHLVDLHRPSTSTSALNEAVYAYSPTPTREDVKCRISSFSLEDRERLQALGSAFSGAGGNRIMFDGSEDVQVKDRVTDGTTVWEIVGIEDVDHRGIVLETLAVIAKGVVDV